MTIAYVLLALLVTAVAATVAYLRAVSLFESRESKGDKQAQPKPDLVPPKDLGF